MEISFTTTKKKNQPLKDDELYKERFSVERTNAWIDAFKALLVRFETKSHTRRHRIQRQHFRSGLSRRRTSDLRPDNSCIRRNQWF